MKKRISRLMKVILMMVLVFSMLAACGKDSETLDDPASNIGDGSDQGSEPESDGLMTLPVPVAYIDNLGRIHITEDENVEGYMLKYEDNDEIVYVEDNLVIMPGRQVRIKAFASDMDVRLESDYSDVISCPSDYITFSATENTLDTAIDNGDGTYTLEVVSNHGKKYTFLIEGMIENVTGGWGTLTGKVRVTSTTALHGVFGCRFEPMEDVADINVGIDFGFELDGNDFVQKYEDVDCWMESSTLMCGQQSIDYFSNYFSFTVGNEGDAAPASIEEWRLYFNGTESEFERCEVHPYFYEALFLPGAPYVASAADAPLRLYFNNGGVMCEPIDYNGGFFGTMTVDRLLDANGNEISDPDNHYMSEGDRVEVTLEGKLTTTYSLLKEPYNEAVTSNEAFPNSFANLTGNMNVIVVPVYWSDQADRATDANKEILCRALGNVMDEQGNVTSYSTDNPKEPSLSEYYKTASYGKLTVNSFVTDWYAFPDSYENVYERTWDAMMLEDLLIWLKETYRDMDHSMFDNDKDGLYDEIILINTGDMSGYSSYTRDGMSGAYRQALQYGGYETAPYVGMMSGMRTPENPYLYTYINMAFGFLFDNNIMGDASNMRTKTLIHEFGHTLGLYDYYDNGTAGISALGGYDMQDASVGDWNVYSKYTAGWIEPVVVDEESFAGQDTVEFTIKSSALNGDALLIPAAGYDYNGTPFDEYIMLDLFTPEGLHTYDSAIFALDNAVGVRIYHVSDRLVYGYYDVMLNEAKEFLEYGARVHSNDSDKLWSDKYGFYQIEIISATGNNKFTSKTSTDRNFLAEDLFGAGDSFSVEEYDEFFYNGKMDCGVDFGYEITVKSITQTDGEYTATIAISRKK